MCSWEVTHLLNMSVTRSISCSAAAIFSADDGCGLPIPNIDIFKGGGVVLVFDMVCKSVSARL